MITKSDVDLVFMLILFAILGVTAVRALRKGPNR